VGAVPFLLEPGNWEELTVRCAFGAQPAEEDAAALAELLHGWAVVAATADSPPGASRPAAGRAGCTRQGCGSTERKSSRRSTWDLPAGAFDVLGAALAAFAGDRTPLARVVIGGTRARRLPDTSCQQVRATIPPC